MDTAQSPAARSAWWCGRAAHTALSCMAGISAPPDRIQRDAGAGADIL